jgi:hypothetical protein
MQHIACIVSLKAFQSAVRCQAISDPTWEKNEAVCWQCGAPADPARARTVHLYAQPIEHQDGQGYPVVRHWWHHVVRVSIPRCEACRNQNWLAVFLMPTSFMVGCALGGFPLWRWTTIIGGVIGCVTIALGFVLHERLSGRRSTDT